MKTVTLGLSISLSVLLSGWMSAAAADNDDREAQQEYERIEAEYKEFKQKIKALDLSAEETNALSKFKTALLASKARNEKTKAIISFFGPNAEYSKVINDTLGGLSDDELIEAVMSNRKRNLDFAGDITKKIEDGKKAEQILQQTQNTRKPLIEAAQLFPYEHSLNQLIYNDFLERKISTVKVKLDRVPDNPKNIALTFSNSSDNLSFTQISMKIDIKAEGRDVPYYTVKNINYPFLTPLKPGEERQEIISCGTDCQKAMAHDNVYGSFVINGAYARVSGSNRLLSLSSTDDWNRHVCEADLQKLTQNREKTDAYLSKFSEEAEKLENMLK